MAHGQENRAHPWDIPCATKAQERAFRAHVLTITAFKSFYKYGYLPAQESYDNAVDPGQRDDASQEVGWLKSISLPVSSSTDDSNQQTLTDSIGWS